MEYFGAKACPCAVNVQKSVDERICTAFPFGSGHVDQIQIIEIALLLGD